MKTERINVLIRKRKKSYQSRAKVRCNSDSKNPKKKISNLAKVSSCISDNYPFSTGIIDIKREDNDYSTTK